MTPFEELRWLQEHPDFEERPMSLSEFLGPDYLNVEGMIRPRIRQELENIMGAEVSGERLTKFSLAMITGGIGIGKTTVASIVLPYMAHWVLCLRDPQKFFKLLPGSRIAFMQMSTSEKQALEVVFGDIKARIEHSPWFQKYPFDTRFKNQLRFAKDIWILPGDSEETTFEGYNILGGILDEADSHKVTPRMDYAEQGYATIFSRIQSRFQDRGFLLVIGQMKKSTGFAARKFQEFKSDPNAYAVRLAIWDSMGDEFYRNPKTGQIKKFAYDTFRKQIVPSGIAEMLPNANILWIPDLYRKGFEQHPEKSLRDLAGIPPAAGQPFISLVDKIHACRDRWLRRYPSAHGGPVRSDGRLEPWFRAPDTLPRVCHVDVAFAGGGDALGFAMAHVPEVVEIEGERKPYIVVDMLLRIKVPEGKEIFLGDIRRIVYSLREDRGFRIRGVTLDGFQSQDSIQQFRRHRFECDYLSIDRQLLPYHDLREAIYEDRLDFPPYLVKYNFEDEELTEVAIKELTELEEGDRKVDHPELGSKDIADALAGCVTTLMGDRRYHKKVVSIFSTVPSTRAQGGFDHPALVGTAGMTSLIPPTIDELMRDVGR